MIHFPDASVQLTAMMCSIRFPIQTRATPYRTSIVGTNKDIFGVELLKTGHWSIFTGSAFATEFFVRRRRIETIRSFLPSTAHQSVATLLCSAADVS